MIRDAKTVDFPVILALNSKMEQYMSALDEELLSNLHDIAVYHRVIEVEPDGVVGFLLALREGASYGSPNYRWFAERYQEFLYIDRVALAPSQQGRGLGRLLYDDVFAFARARGVSTVTLEFDIDPPNEASRRFHAKCGFREVGTQWVAGGKKLVSLQVAEVG